MKNNFKKYLFFLILIFGIQKLHAQLQDSIPSDSMSMYISNVLIRNCESPNEKECAFKPIFSVPPIEYEIWIFDRWGNQVFETKDFNYGWEGKNASEKMYDSGIYVWKIKCTYNNGRKAIYLGKCSLIY